MADPNNYYVQVHDQEQLLRLPRRIAADALDDIPEAYRAAYVEEEDPSRGFRLVTSVADVIRDGSAQIAALKAQFDGLKTKYETDLATAKQSRVQDKIDAALYSTCKDAGVPDGLMEGAIALLSRDTTFEVDESYEFGGGTVIATRDGRRHSVEGLVESFLDSDEGAGFRGKRRAAPSDGYFTGLLGRR
ncbi:MULTISPECIES: hypothetical protein [unclassified Mesorhizobium]|uniref:hypothetical protein n=1 Tax=unclassified Mesorhizobium TaxID=325217 RepID=UPI000FD83491|nr:MULTISPECIES: hypothetical protein [unclassified Mesorhizobium]TGQ08703.1 hypothetical protein EN862_020860 [Mesorhizobium sp. M2E.F.Ca.ET.219.01.1.1]TGT69238.1 hypothetical protein EN809_023140 [Mesorhizobium sp. M2E.F.Ca.ET.166.01.1.1]TGW01570.1 hypothetical protein EN797_014635 [Mesorhizobium sp. M2E.F.Ca.ET.154.01.1.1]